MFRRARVEFALVALSVVLVVLNVTTGLPQSVVLLVVGATALAGLAGARWWLVAAADGATFLVVDPNALSVGDLTFSGGLLTAAYLLGRAVYSRRHRVGALEQEALLAAERHEVLVGEAIAAERAAMAVELHDIVTHAVSAIVVQAQAGRRSTAAAAQDSLLAIEQTARTAMAELRRLLTVLTAVDSRTPAPPGRDTGRWRDLAVAVAIAGLGELELWSGEKYDGAPVWPGPRWFSALLVIALGTALLVRRRNPELMVGCVVGLLVVEGLTVGSTEAATGPVLLVVAVFSAAHGARLRVLVPAAVLLCSVYALTDAHAAGLFDRLWWFGLAAAALSVGWAVRRRQTRIAALEGDAATTADQHARALSEALAAERRGLALELHDIVSHAVSVIVIQAQAGTRSPPSAQDALRAIEGSARAAMTELRRLLLLLLPEGAHGDVRPAASLLQLNDLLLRWRTAGLQVELTAHDLPALPPAVDLTAYRIVQESLTNSARHAPGARVHVDLSVVGDQLEVRTRDFGTGGPSTAPGAGRGLIGMRQRVELVGGQLVAVGQSDAGFLVHARLPLAAVPA